MNWFKKILGLDRQERKLDELSTLTKKLLDKENKANDLLYNNFIQLNQDVKQANHKMLVAQIEENENSLEFKSEVNRNLSSIKKEVQLFSQKQQEQLETVKADVIKIKGEVLPKPFNPNFSLVDPLDFNKSIFSFEITKSRPQNLQVTNVNTNDFLRNIGSSIPELVSGGLLSQSYRFIFPNGVSGEVMKIGSGQGTAIMQGGKIINHGTYIANFTVAAPLIAYSFGSMIIRQHYLAKINRKLANLDLSVSNLIEFEFIKKQVKIEAIIFFFEKAKNEYSFIESNKEYRGAILSNLVSKNIEIFELIQFYKKSMKFIKKENTTENELNFKYFLALHTLYYQGKLLEFKYAFEYNKTLITNLKTSFIEINKQCTEFIISNRAEIEKQILNIDVGFIDWIFGRKTTKINQINALNNTIITVDEIIKYHTEEPEKLTSELDQLILDIDKKREYYIENGKLYEVLQ